MGGNGMLSKKHLAALKKDAKRHATRPTPAPQASKLTATGSVERRVVRDHLGLLQLIESTLVQAHSQNPSVDDRVVAEALKSAIRQIAPEEAVVAEVLERLKSEMGLQFPVSDELWTEVLQTVNTSVHRHSSCEAGDMVYLHFIANYIR
jgi:hypothetical protein